MDNPTKNDRAFLYRAGVRLAGTVVACDAAAGGDLVFLSHAAVLGARRRRALPRVGGGRRQILATDATLTLLGPVGDRLRAQALVTPYGRPFALGDLRLELFPSGYLPGAASLLCERAGRRFVYAGPIGDGGEVRAADALCLDARYAFPDVAFPDRATADEGLRRLVRPPAGGGAPIVLVDPPALAPLIARALSVSNVPLRAHRAILDALAVDRAVGAAGPGPTAQRFAGRLATDEVLLWPADARPPAQGGDVTRRRAVLVSPRAESAGMRGRSGPAERLTYPFGADLVQLARYAAQTGAAEVALVGAPDDALAELLRRRGVAAYRLGPPRQIDLFAAG